MCTVCVSWWLSWHHVSKLAWSLCRMATHPPTFLFLLPVAALSQMYVFPCPYDFLAVVVLDSSTAGQSHSFVKSVFCPWLTASVHTAITARPNLLVIAALSLCWLPPFSVKLSGSKSCLTRRPDGNDVCMKTLLGGVDEIHSVVYWSGLWFDWCCL